MGIKFLCPNGHKLNVKSFLEGKRAICPKCGARVVVPSQESLASGDRQEALDPDALAEATSDAGVASESREAASSPVTATEATPGDPFVEAPTAVWYVRPATGGQFGPASADIMRAWLREGRVGASSLVWRAGWPEWRAASAVFPQLAGLLASPGITVGPPQLAGGIAAAARATDGNAPALPVGTSLPPGQIVQSVGAGPDNPGSLAPPLPSAVRRRRRNEKNLLASVVLAVVVVVLLIVLFIVIRRQYATEDIPPGQSRPAAESERS
jgi:hypothetical protein